MKRLLVVLVAMTLLLAVAGCGIDKEQGFLNLNTSEIGVTNTIETEVVSTTLANTTTTDKSIVTTNTSCQTVVSLTKGGVTKITDTTRMVTTVTTTTTTKTSIVTTTVPQVSEADCREGLYIFGIGEGSSQWDVSYDRQTVTMKFDMSFAVGQKESAKYDVQHIEIVSALVNGEKCEIYQTSDSDNVKKWKYYDRPWVQGEFESENVKPLKIFTLISPVIKDAPYIEPLLDNQYAVIDLKVFYRVYFSNGATTEFCDCYDRKEDGGGLLWGLTAEDYS